MGQMSPAEMAVIQELVRQLSARTQPKDRKASAADMVNRPMAPTKDGQSESADKVMAPRAWQSSPEHDKAMLAYITPKEANELRRLDMHGSGVDKKMHYGPANVPSFQGDGDGGSGGDAPGGGDAPSGGESSAGAPSYGDFGEGGGWSGDGAPSSSQPGGDGLTGGVPGNTVADVNTQGGGQPGGGFGGPSPGGPSATAFGDYGGISSLGLADTSPASVVGEAAGRSHTNEATNFGIGFANTLASILGQFGIGSIFGPGLGGKTSPLGMAAAVGGMFGGIPGQVASIGGLANSAAGLAGFSTGVSGQPATGLAGNMGAAPDDGVSSGNPGTADTSGGFTDSSGSGNPSGGGPNDGGDGTIADAARASGSGNTLGFPSSPSTSNISLLARALRSVPDASYSPGETVFGSDSGDTPARNVWNRSSLRVTDAGG